MYLIGEVNNGYKFKSIYAVFENKDDLDNYNLRHPNEYVKLHMNVKFPVFIVEEFENSHREYVSISKEELRIKVQKIKKTNNTNTIYFNLWRIDQSMYNEHFPDEPILRGKDFHIHFMNTDFEEIETYGFDKYWRELNNNRS